MEQSQDIVLGTIETNYMTHLRMGFFKFMRVCYEDTSRNMKSMKMHLTTFYICERLDKNDCQRKSI